MAESPTLSRAPFDLAASLAGLGLDAQAISAYRPRHHRNAAYVNPGQSPGTASVDALGNVRYTAPEQRGCARTRMFYLDWNGVIYGWRWQGL